MKRQLYSYLFRKLSSYILSRRKCRIYDWPSCWCLRLQWKLSKKLALIDIKERVEPLPVSEKYKRLRKRYLKKEKLMGPTDV